MATAIVADVLGVLGGLFKTKPDPRIQADLVPAYNRRDVAYLYAWVHDVPPHPADSVAVASQMLAQLTGSTSTVQPSGSPYGGRLAASQPAPSIDSYGPPTGGLPVQTPSGPGYVPYWSGK
jgi:hypothetical protein